MRLKCKKKLKNKQHGKKYTLKFLFTTKSEKRNLSNEKRMFSIAWWFEGDYSNLNPWGLAGGLAGGVRCEDGLVGLVGLGLAGLPGPGLKSAHCCHAMHTKSYCYTYCMWNLHKYKPATKNIYAFTGEQNILADGNKSFRFRILWNCLRECLIRGNVQLLLSLVKGIPREHFWAIIIRWVFVSVEYLRYMKN
jgi:hypothetical protein